MTPYETLCAQTRQLHALIREGKGESPEADKLRDEMDVSWAGCTSEETERARDLSARLYEDPEAPACACPVAFQDVTDDLMLRGWKAGFWPNLKEDTLKLGSPWPPEPLQAFPGPLGCLVHTEWAMLR